MESQSAFQNCVYCHALLNKIVKLTGDKACLEITEVYAQTYKVTLLIHYCKIHICKVFYSVANGNSGSKRVFPVAHHSN